MLYDLQSPAQTVRRLPIWAIAACFAILIGSALADRLTAQESRPPNQPAAPAKAAANQPDAPARAAPEAKPAADAPAKAGQEPAEPADANAETLTCTGIVQDAIFGKPLEGARVTILKLATPQTSRVGDSKLLQKFELITDANGKYTFKLSTDQPYEPETNSAVRASRNTAQGFGEGRFRFRAGLSYFPLQIEVKHPEYAPHQTSASVYLSQLTGNSYFDGNGFAPPAESSDPTKRSITPLQLRPGKAVTGILQSADGKPVAGVKIVAHSLVPRNEREIPGVSRSQQPPAAKDETRSDPNGRFRVTMITPGEGMLAIYPASQFAPQFKLLYDKRGDLGVVKLEAGAAIQGRVLDTEGKPLAGLYVSVNPGDRWTDYSLYGLNREPRRTSVTNAAGEFLISPLPAGEYHIAPSEEFDDPSGDPRDVPAKRPLPAIFVPQKLVVVDGKPAAPIDLRAIPIVTVQGRIIVDETIAETAQQLIEQINSRGNIVSLYGRLNETAYRQKLEVDDAGNFKLLAPKGLDKVMITATSTNGSRQPRWRIGKDQPFRTELTIDLGTLYEDLKDVEIDYSRAAGRGGFAGQLPAEFEELVGRGRAGGRAGPNLAGDAALDGVGGRVVAQPGGRGGGGGGRAAQPAAARGGQGGRRAGVAARGVFVPPPEGVAPNELVCTGLVHDADSGAGIAGAKVALWQHEIIDNVSSYRPMGEMATDADGIFTLTISTEQLKDLAGAVMEMHIDAQIKHEQYVTRRQPTELTVTATARSLRLQPVQMRRGREVTGVLHSPDGKSAAGVKVFSATHEDETLTDADGRFRLMAPLVGESTLWIYPAKDFVPMKHIAADGADLGVIALRPGPILKGRVVDAQGKPLAGAWVRAMSHTSDESFPKVWRNAVSDAQGNFAFAPLPAGDYEVGLPTFFDDPTLGMHDARPKWHPLVDFFVPRKVTLVDGGPPNPIEIRPSPTAVIEGRVKLGANARRSFQGAEPNNENLFSRYAPTIIGLAGGVEYRPNVTIDADGKFTAKVPRGLSEVQVQLAGQQTRGPQWRTSKDKPLVDPLAIQLGTVTADVRDLEIVYP